MITLTSKAKERVQATGARFAGKVLYVSLNDGREIGLHLDKVPWLKWLAEATPKKRANWVIEPGGFAIHWNDLDDGIEVCHLLDMKPIM